MESRPPPLDTPPLAPGEIHIWRATDADVSAGCQSMFGLLSADERARAAGYKLDTDRTRFIFCRGALRILLSRYTRRPADEIRFTYGPFGKPSLAGSVAASGICGTGSPSPHFNIAHTRGMALLALSATLPLGVDVEEIDPVQNWEATARHFFHPDERAAQQSLRAADQAAAGYALWTCKEACLKAVGEGIGGGLETFRLFPPTAGNDVRVNLPGGFAVDHVWLHRLDAGPGFAAALASVGRANGVQMLDWTSSL